MANRTNKVQRKGHKEQIKNRENKQKKVQSKWYKKQMIYRANGIQSK